MSACFECNAPLKKAEKSEVENKVPPYVYETQSNFMKCDICNRIYWQGTHWDMVEKFMEKLAG